MPAKTKLKRCPVLHADGRRCEEARDHSGEHKCGSVSWPTHPEPCVKEFVNGFTRCRICRQPMLAWELRGGGGTDGER